MRPKAAGDEADKAGMSTSVFNLAKNILGAGMLSLPSGVAAFSDSRYRSVRIYLRVLRSVKGNLIKSVW